MNASLVRGLARLALALLLMALVGAAVWQGISLLSGTGQALAPVTGQYYVGAAWMAPASPTAPAPTPTAAIPLQALQPTATPLPTATPAAVETQAAPPQEPEPTPDSFLVDVARAHDIDPAGAYVIVNQNAQRMTIVEEGRVVRTLRISSGDPDRGWFTPAWSGRIGEYWGTFTANGVSADNAWYLFQAGGSILIHSSPYTLAPDGSKLYQGVDELGVFPASRGCIRIAPEDAIWFSAWGPHNIPIVVLPWDGGTGREG
jgi:lipoprotein-anchoring transpeptidase ErfK/SrfK